MLLQTVLVMKIFSSFVPLPRATRVPHTLMPPSIILEEPTGAQPHASVDIRAELTTLSSTLSVSTLGDTSSVHAPAPVVLPDGAKSTVLVLDLVTFRIRIYCDGGVGFP